MQNLNDLALILIASGNKHKIQEFRQILKNFPIEIIGPTEAAERYNLGPEPVVEETGTTYLDNARLKAEAYSAWSSLATLADDSGLEVRALENRPGVWSSRYAPSDAERIAKLLGELEQLEHRGKLEDRTAHFCCRLVLLSGPNSWTNEVRIPGTILRAPRGTGGFGYDPIIELHHLGKTLAEVPYEVTCTQGFRALAAIELFNRLAGLPTTPTIEPLGGFTEIRGRTIKF